MKERKRKEKKKDFVMVRYWDSNCKVKIFWILNLRRLPLCFPFCVASSTVCSTMWCVFCCVFHSILRLPLCVQQYVLPNTLPTTVCSTVACSLNPCSTRMRTYTSWTPP